MKVNFDQQGMSSYPCVYVDGIVCIYSLGDEIDDGRWHAHFFGNYPYWDSDDDDDITKQVNAWWDSEIEKRELERTTDISDNLMCSKGRARL